MAKRCLTGSCLLIACLVLSAACEQGLPSCKLKSCSPCLDCAHLLGGYSGWYTNFRNSCIDAEIGNQPFAIEFIDLITDSPDGYSYLVFELMLDGQIQTIQMAICDGEVPEEGQHAGHTLYTFCSEFEYQGWSEKMDLQVMAGYLVDPGDGSPLQIEGRVNNVKFAPPAQECHVTADIQGTKEGS